MEDNKEKWKNFALGASPTLLILAMSFGNPVGAFFGTLLYCIIGIIVALSIRKANSEKSGSSNPIIIGILTGIFASAILTATSCSNGWGF